MNVAGAPAYELARSPAAAAVGRLASASGLLMSNFEHRVVLELPEQWLPWDRPDLGAPPVWRGGTLPEPKYQAFRHDTLIGSFHPGHRAKWTAHELCHGLVGFAWAPTANRYFHALAARLAEVLPVALWYFFDEAGLRRCPQHLGGGPLYGTFCAACEEAAKVGPRGEDPEADRWRAEGVAFVERELAAVRQSVERGRPVAHRLATLDLASDGLGYAAAHADRLESEEHAAWVERFAPVGAGRYDTLDGLEGRVREVMADLLGGAPAKPLDGDRAWWMIQDVAARIYQVAAMTDGDALDGLHDALDALADDPTERGLAELVQSYVALTDEFALPEPDDVFAVGYDLPGGFGHSARQLAEGIASALPKTAARLGDDLEARAAAFAAADEPRRQPIGRRFAAWLRGEEPGRLADLARLEAALAHPAAPDAEALTLGRWTLVRPDTRVLRSPSAELLTFDWDALAAYGGEPAEDHPSAVLVLPEPGGDVAVVPLSPDDAAALPREPTRRDALALEPATVAALLRCGALTPECYGLVRSEI